MGSATPTYGLRYPLLSEVPNVPSDIRNLAVDVEGKLATKAESGHTHTAQNAQTVPTVWNGYTNGTIWNNVNDWAARMPQGMVSLSIQISNWTVGQAGTWYYRVPAPGYIGWDRDYGANSAHPERGVAARQIQITLGATNTFQAHQIGSPVATLEASGSIAIALPAHGPITLRPIWVMLDAWIMWGSWGGQQDAPWTGVGVTSGQQQAGPPTPATQTNPHGYPHPVIDVNAANMVNSNDHPAESQAFADAMWAARGPKTPTP
jgi:hypothetical protein